MGRAFYAVGNALAFAHPTAPACGAGDGTGGFLDTLYGSRLQKYVLEAQSKSGTWKDWLAARPRGHVQMQPH